MMDQQMNAVMAKRALEPPLLRGKGHRFDILLRDFVLSQALVQNRFLKH
jgi:hypothetical protein